MRIFLSKHLPLGFRAGVSIPLNSAWRAPPQKAASGNMTGAFIYVIKGDHNLVKIGVSTNPDARIAQLRTGSGFPLAFAYICAVEGDTSNAYALERAAHSTIARHQTSGEWFDVAPEMAVAAIAAASHKTGRRIVEIPVDKVAEVIRLASSVGTQEPRAAPTRQMSTLTRLASLVLLFCVFTVLAGVGILFVQGIYWPDSLKTPVWLEAAPFAGALLTYWAINSKS